MTDLEEDVAKANDNTQDESSPLLSSPSPSVKSKFTDFDILSESLSFVCVSGIVGLTNVSFGDNIETLATNVGYTSVEIGGVFVIRCIGSILGALIFPVFSFSFGGLTTLISTFIVFIAVTAYVSFCNSLWLLYILFFLSGFCGAVADTSSMTLMRRLHGKEAGPWMSTCIMAYSVAGVFSLVIQAVSPSVTVSFETIALLALIVLLWIIFENHVVADNYKQPALQCTSSEAATPDGHYYYYVESICAISLFGLMGSAGTMTAYLETYVDDMDVINTDLASYLLMVFWIGLAFSRFVLIFVQKYFKTVQVLSNTIITLSVICMIAASLILAFSTSGVVLWIGVSILSLGLGPGAGLVYDINNKLSRPSDVSTAILMIGINVGGGFASYITSALWDYTSLSGYSLFITIWILTFLSLIIIFVDI